MKSYHWENFYSWLECALAMPFCCKQLKFHPPLWHVCEKSEACTWKSVYAETSNNFIGTGYLHHSTKDGLRNNIGSRFSN